ncbi:MAG: hypothetical protein OXL41_02050 [Nitrospinae bacterium]|nr:hypothetical protein [Nitrospinota bacterium]
MDYKAGENVFRKRLEREFKKLWSATGDQGKVNFRDFHVAFPLPVQRQWYLPAQLC